MAGMIKTFPIRAAGFAASLHDGRLRRGDTVDFNLVISLKLNHGEVGYLAV